VSGITLYALYDRISVFHSLAPFLFSRHSKLFTFTDSAEYCLKRDRNDTVIMVRQFLKPDVVDTDLLSRIREKYRRVVFFNGNAGGGIPRLEVLPLVDRFYAKALFRDRALYGRALYGGELYSDHAHRAYGITDPAERPRATESRPEQLAKLRLSWNIGVGDYPRRKLVQRAGVAVARTAGLGMVRPFYNRRNLSWPQQTARDIDVHARIDLVSKPSVAHHRRLILDAISGDPRFLTGRVGQKQYNAELSRSRVTLSPFGWGELCLRDFEAVLAGSLLLKPDMSHLETWPEVFVPGESYVAFEWDGTDVVETAAHYLENEAERARIARAAYDTYLEQVSRVEERVEAVLSDIDTI